MNLRRLNFSTLVCGELLGVFALALTPDVEKGALAGALGLLVLLLAGGIRLGDRALFGSVGAIVVVGAYAGYFGDQAIAITLSRGLIALHALLWLSRSSGQYRFWRLGIAFLEIILAAILSPETHMFLIIFFFAMISSLALCFSFLERKLGRESNPAIPAQLLGSTVVLTFLVFLSSLFIFPILPRSSGTGFGRQWAEPGYTETVNLRSSLSWAGGSSRPMLWIFRPEGQWWPELVPMGLLRGAVLDRFTGDEWVPGAKQVSTASIQPGEVKLEILREPMDSNILPIPYGTARVEYGGREHPQYVSAEWPARFQRNRRLKYEVTLGGPAPADEPKASHLQKADPKTIPMLGQIAARWRGSSGSEEEKISRVIAHFRDFKWKLAAMEGTEAGGLHPVENFLRNSKEGHCELFATATALLFRELGMPARVVAGFRVFPSGDVLTARNTDAHAWVEVWVKEKGWVPVDPSPVLAQAASWEITDLYDRLNAYWYQYIVGYEFDGRALLARWRGPGLAAAAAILFLLILIRLRSWFRPVSRHPRQGVTKAWRKIEKRFGDRLARPEFAELHQLYLELRFGPSELGPEQVRALKEKASGLIRASGAR